MLAAFGYSINLVTLLALALSIGLVVDDAIVVLENAHRRIEEGEAPLLAAFNGTRQVAFAVIATTVVLVSVFAPVAFLRDSIGRVFAELAVTIAAAVIFSAVLALSLSPMMCSKLLRSSTKESKLTHTLDQAFVVAVEPLSGGAARDAARAVGVGRGLRRDRVRRVSCCCKTIPQEYAPVEDRGQFNGQIQAPEGTSYERLRESAMKVEAALQKYFDDGSVQRGIVSVPGWGNNGSGIVNVTLKPWGERKISTQEMLERPQQAVGGDPRRSRQRVHEQRQPRRRRRWRRRHRPVQLVLGGPNYEELARWRDIIIARASENPGLVRLDSDLRETQPQVLVRVDQDRAASLGVTARSIGSTLQTLMSERQVTTYVVDGEEYDVVLQAKPEQRASYSDLSNIFVRAERSGELIPLSNLMALEDLAGPSQLQRHNRMRAVTLSAQARAGLHARRRRWTISRTSSARELPSTAQIDYRGESLEYKEASGALYFTFGIALFVVFLVLAAQFESFVHPLVIMVTVPLAVAGGLLGLWLSGKTLNIYSQIGIIMLVGIAAKNGVLIVEFINQLRDKGMEFKDAIVEASRIRLRPVIMTAFAAVMGSVPLILAEGPGSASRAALGVVIFSGVTLRDVLHAVHRAGRLQPHGARHGLAERDRASARRDAHGAGAESLACSLRRARARWWCMHPGGAAQGSVNRAETMDQLPAEDSVLSRGASSSMSSNPPFTAPGSPCRRTRSAARPTTASRFRRDRHGLDVPGPAREPRRHGVPLPRRRGLDDGVRQRGLHAAHGLCARGSAAERPASRTRS